MNLATLPGRGTLLNVATVLVGGLIGLSLRGVMEPEMLPQVQIALGLVTMLISVRMFFASRQPVVVIVAVAFGALLGHMLGIQQWVVDWASYLQQRVGQGSAFSQGLIVTSILFCVGPLTILGCLQDAVERKIDLLAMKSAMDGIVCIFFAAAYGWGAVAAAAVVLVVQGLLTALAWPLRGLKDDDEALAEISGVGGPILLAVGLSITELLKVDTANFLPALVLAPALVMLARRFRVARRADA